MYANLGTYTHQISVVPYLCLDFKSFTEFKTNILSILGHLLTISFKYQVVIWPPTTPHPSRKSPKRLLILKGQFTVLDLGALLFSKYTISMFYVDYGI